MEATKSLRVWALWGSKGCWTNDLCHYPSGTRVANVHHSNPYWEMHNARSRAPAVCVPWSRRMAATVSPCSLSWDFLLPCRHTMPPRDVWCFHPCCLSLDTLRKGPRGSWAMCRVRCFLLLPHGRSPTGVPWCSHYRQHGDGALSQSVSYKDNDCTHSCSQLEIKVVKIRHSRRTEVGGKNTSWSLCFPLELFFPTN